MAKGEPREFYVVLRNVSAASQPVWEYWNSWGYTAISFELMTADGKRFVITVRDRDFTLNFPSTFTVAPGEYQVFAIRLDRSWQVQPALPMKDEMPITLKATYEVAPDPESLKYKVWTGRVESRTYNLSLFQY
jgi:hypothetical protein